MFKSKLALLLISFLPLFAACGNQSTVSFPHIHGLGFSPDASQLIVPAHDGLRFYSDGNWQIPNVPVRDYMGYSPVDQGFYSSGHPSPQTGEVNPLGLIMSVDDGESLIRLGFEGVSDFHLMGVGYQSHAIYVINQYPNSLMAEGLHYSLNDGETWQASAASGLSVFPWQIAVHPTEPGAVALASDLGLYWSTDFGQTFSLVSNIGPVTSAAFDPNGELLLFGSTGLWQYQISSETTEAIAIPTLASEEFILYIAASGNRQIAFATTDLNIFLSEDNGATWTKIANESIGI